MSDCPCVPCPNAASQRNWREMAETMERRALAAEARLAEVETAFKADMKCHMSALATERAETARLRAALGEARVRLVAVNEPRLAPMIAALDDFRSGAIVTASAASVPIDEWNRAIAETARLKGENERLREVIVNTEFYMRNSGMLPNIAPSLREQWTAVLASAPAPGVLAAVTPSGAAPSWAALQNPQEPVALVEAMAESAHDSWWEAYKLLGYSSRKAAWGEEFMVPFAELSEQGKEFDRVIMRAILRAFDRLGYHVSRLAAPSPPAEKTEGDTAEAIAVWLESELSDDCSDAIAALRSGAWRRGHHG